MTTREQHHLDVVSIGETLIDFISDEEQGLIGDSRAFHMYPGGQATNVALNVARLGGSTALVARVGEDSFGEFLRYHLNAAGVQIDYVHVTPRTPTTLVVVTRSHQTPDFNVYRGADARMLPTDMPLDLIPVTSLIHTSAFALSHEPARSTVLQFIERVHRSGCLISFDPNYHPRLWNADERPLEVFTRICPFVTLTKPSLDDCIRIFGAGQTPEAYAERFLALGVQNVVLTMGQGGVLLANARGNAYYSANQVEVVDVTGAGDSFWAGLLLATVDGYEIADAVKVGQAVASIKIQQVGPLTHMVDRQIIYRNLGLTN